MVGCHMRVQQLPAVLLCVIGCSLVTANSNCVRVEVEENVRHFQTIIENNSVTVSCTLDTTRCNADYSKLWFIQTELMQHHTNIDDLEHIRDHPYSAIRVLKNGFSLTLQGLKADLKYVLLHCGARELNTESPQEVLARDVMFIEILPIPVASTAPQVATAAISSSPMDTIMETLSGTPGAPDAGVLQKQLEKCIDRCQKSECSAMSRTNIAIVAVVPSLAVMVLAALLGLIILRVKSKRKPKTGKEEERTSE